MSAYCPGPYDPGPYGPGPLAPYGPEPFVFKKNFSKSNLLQDYI